MPGSGLRRSGWIEVGNGEGAQHACRALGAARYRAFTGVVPEINFDDAYRFERGECFGSGEIETGGLELLFDRPMKQERQCGDEDMRLHAIVSAVIDRAQIDDVLEIGERALDFR